MAAEWAALGWLHFPRQQQHSTPRTITHRVDYLVGVRIENVTAARNLGVYEDHPIPFWFGREAAANPLPLWA